MEIQKSRIAKAILSRNTDSAEAITPSVIIEPTKPTRYWHRTDN